MVDLIASHVSPYILILMYSHLSKGGGHCCLPTHLGINNSETLVQRKPEILPSRNYDLRCMGQVSEFGV